VFAVVMTGLFMALSPLEHRPLPWWDRPATATGARSVAAGALVCAAGVAVLLMAKFGLSGVAGYSALGVFLVAIATARLAAVLPGPVAAIR
jgi:hypothetical protein